MLTTTDDQAACSQTVASRLPLYLLFGSSNSTVRCVASNHTHQSSTLSISGVIAAA